MAPPRVTWDISLGSILTAGSMLVGVVVFIMNGNSKDVEQDARIAANERAITAGRSERLDYQRGNDERLRLMIEQNNAFIREVLTRLARIEARVGENRP